MASASQSLAEPSANAMPSTISPMSSVRRSAQIASRERQPPAVAGRLARAASRCARERVGLQVAHRDEHGRDHHGADRPRGAARSAGRSARRRRRAAAPTMVPMLNMRVEQRHHGAAERALVRGALDVHRDVAQPVAEAEHAPGPRARRAAARGRRRGRRPRARRPRRRRCPRSIACEPIRAIAWLDRVSPKIEPNASPKTTRPICSVLAPSASRIAGVRAIQLAMPTPDIAKITKTAVRHCDHLTAGQGWPACCRRAKSWRGDPSEAGGRSRRSLRGSCAVESIRSNRFDYPRTHDGAGQRRQRG